MNTENKSISFFQMQISCKQSVHKANLGLKLYKYVGGKLSLS